MRQLLAPGKANRMWLPAAAFAVLLVVGGAALADRAAANTGTVNLKASPFGKILVSANGHALYLFKHDATTASTCYGTCATDWPPLLTKSAKPRAGSGVSAKLLGTTRRKDGRLQVTYHGHPLYWFFLDKQAGQTKGQGQNFFGGKWYVANAAGLAVVKKPASAPTGGYGYP